MASNGKRKTTMAKLNREARLRERRQTKEANKQERQRLRNEPGYDPSLQGEFTDPSLQPELSDPSLTPDDLTPAGIAPAHPTAADHAPAES